LVVLGKTLRDVYSAMLTAYRVKDKRQGAKDALEIYRQNMDDMVSVLQDSLNIISEQKREAYSDRRP
jgi:hypothetical protein